MIHEATREILEHYATAPTCTMTASAFILDRTRGDLWAGLRRLEKLGYVEKLGRGKYQITKAGRDALRS